MDRLTPLPACSPRTVSARPCAVVEEHRIRAHVKAVILNSGGANACTGKPGYEQSKATAEKVAGLIGAKAEDVAVCSTGLIGELLPLDNVLSGADKAFETLADTAEAGADASHAIMTTDTKPKTVELEGPTASVSVAWSRFRHDRPAAGHHAVRHHHRCVVTAGQLQAALTPESKCRSTASTWTAACPPTTPCCCWLPARPASNRTRTSSTSLWPSHRLARPPDHRRRRRRKP